MKYLKIENNKGYYCLGQDNWQDIDRINKDDLLILLDKAIETDFEMDEYEPRSRVEFETVASEKVNFGRNNFLEIARKRAKTDDGENEFISVSRGYYLPDGSERFKKSLTIPDDEEIRSFVADKIKTM